MAPLVPDIISSEMNLIVAFIVGIGFGFALEQAGFSSTRKLVGLFYGYDFTVLKVFFTAGLTAMTGVLLFSHLGLLDLSVIYINPTFLYSALIGGVIMGAGFIIGGFCPGTSICAAAVGRIDALAFIGGSVIGILIFTEAYPAIEPLYMASSMGALTMYEMLNLSPEAFGILLTAVAVFAFCFTSKVEDWVNGRQVSFDCVKQLRYAFPLVIPFAFITSGRVTSTFGISLGLYLVILTAATVAVLWLLYRINRADMEEVIPSTPTDYSRVKYVATAAMPFFLITMVWITPSKKEYTLSKVEQQAVIQKASLESMTVDKLAFELMHHAHWYNVVDVRGEEAFESGTIPSAMNIPYGQMYNRQWRQTYRQTYKTNIFVADDPQTARKAALLAKELGDDNPMILQTGVTRFRDIIFNPTEPAGDATKAEVDRYRFHKEASQQLKAMEERLKNLQKPPQKKIQKIQGGCV